VEVSFPRNILNTHLLTMFGRQILFQFRITYFVYDSYLEHNVIHIRVT